MTYLTYIAWILSLGLVAGELDRLIFTRLVNRIFIELPPKFLGFISPIASALLPGTGQYFNRQPLKALFFLLWPIFLLYTPYMRPWQMVPMSSNHLIPPWYLAMLLDALIAGVILGRGARTPFEADTNPARANDLIAYLERRQR